MRFANNIDQFNFFSGFIDDVRDTERDFEQKLDEMLDETRIKNTKFSERLEILVMEDQRVSLKI